MNKRLLLSHIKGLTFMLQTLIEYYIDFLYHKKARELRFFLLVSTVAFVLKTIKTFIFPAVKKVSTSQTFSLSKKNVCKKFPPSRKNLCVWKLSLIREKYLFNKEFSLNEEIF